MPILEESKSGHSSESDDQDYNTANDGQDEHELASSIIGSDGQPIRLLSNWETYFTLLKGFVCSSFLYIPRAFVESGWVYSSLILIATSALVTYT